MKNVNDKGNMKAECFIVQMEFPQMENYTNVLNFCYYITQIYDKRAFFWDTYKIGLRLLGEHPLP